MTPESKTTSWRKLSGKHDTDADSSFSNEQQQNHAETLGEMEMYEEAVKQAANAKYFMLCRKAEDRKVKDCVHRIIEIDRMSTKLLNGTVAHSYFILSLFFYLIESDPRFLKSSRPHSVASSNNSATRSPYSSSPNLNDFVWDEDVINNTDNNSEIGENGKLFDMKRCKCCLCKRTPVNITNSPISSSPLSNLKLLTTSSTNSPK